MDSLDDGIDILLRGNGDVFVAKRYGHLGKERVQLDGGNQLGRVSIVVGNVEMRGKQRTVEADVVQNNVRNEGKVKLAAEGLECVEQERIVLLLR